MQNFETNPHYNIKLTIKSNVKSIATTRCDTKLITKLITVRDEQSAVNRTDWFLIYIFIGHKLEDAALLSLSTSR